MTYSGEFPLKFCFSYGQYMIACFHECFAPELSKLVNQLTNHADSNYDRQFVHREYPDYETLRDLTQESVAPV